MIAGTSDILTRRIPNWLTVAGALCGLLLSAYLAGFAGLRESALGLGLAMLVYLLFFALHAMGAGDVKLMGAVGAVVGVAVWWRIFILTSILGGVFALCVLVWQKRLGQTLWNVSFILREISHFRAPFLTRQELDVQNTRAVKLPHGAAIALGTLAYLALEHFGNIPISN